MWVIQLNKITAHYGKTLRVLEFSKVCYVPLKLNYNSGDVYKKL